MISRNWDNVHLRSLINNQIFVNISRIICSYHEDEIQHICMWVGELSVYAKSTIDSDREMDPGQQFELYLIKIQQRSRIKAKELGFFSEVSETIFIDVILIVELKKLIEQNVKNMQILPGTYPVVLNISGAGFNWANSQRGGAFYACANILRSLAVRRH